VALEQCAPDRASQCRSARDEANLSERAVRQRELPNYAVSVVRRLARVVHGPPTLGGSAIRADPAA